MPDPLPFFGSTALLSVVFRVRLEMYMSGTEQSIDHVLLPTIDRVTGDIVEVTCRAST